MSEVGFRSANNFTFTKSIKPSLNSMKFLKEGNDAPVNTVPTYLGLAEKKHENYGSDRNYHKNTSCQVIEHKIETKEPLWKCRYIIVIISFLLYFYMTYIRLNMSINVVAMVNSSAVSHQVEIKSESCPSLIKNFTEDETNFKKGGEFNWSPKLQGYILGSYFFGYFVTQMPCGLLVERYGCKWFLFASSFVAGVSTLLIPLFSYISASSLILLLVLRGLSQGLVQSSLAVLAANWFPKVERGFLYTFMHSGTGIGSCTGGILSGYICDSAGNWTASFYVTGAGGLLLTVLVLYFVAENPRVHPRISKAEMNFILSNQENALLRRRPKLPWRKMLKSIPVYALAYAYFGQTWAMCQFFTVHSTFLATILHYPIEQNGLFTALPFMLQFLGAQGAAWITFYVQKNTKVRTDFLRKVVNLIGSFGTSASLFGMYLSGCNRTVSVLFAILSIGCTGIAYSGCWVVPIDMSPTFAGTIHAFCCTLGFMAGFLVPVVTGYLTDEMQTIEQWNKVFFLSIGVVMSSGILFSIFGSAEVQSWNFVEEKTTEEARKQTENGKEETQID